jgi:hypothetical protein
MSRPQKKAEVDECSGVTRLRPVPVEPARLSELSECDSTQYFSATELLERGKALSARASEPVPVAAQHAPPKAETLPQREGWLVQLRRASPARLALAILLPFSCVLLLARPRLEQRAHTGARPSAPVTKPSTAALAKSALPKASASAAPPPLLPRGVTLVRAAADSVATGDFSRAALLYRELSRREPKSRVYLEAARILSERETAHTP